MGRFSDRAIQQISYVHRSVVSGSFGAVMGGYSYATPCPDATDVAPEASR